MTAARQENHLARCKCGGYLLYTRDTLDGPEGECVECRKPDVVHSSVACDECGVIYVTYDGPDDRGLCPECVSEGA